LVDEGGRDETAGGAGVEMTRQRVLRRGSRLLRCAHAARSGNRGAHATSSVLLEQQNAHRSWYAFAARQRANTFLARAADVLRKHRAAVRACAPVIGMTPIARLARHHPRRLSSPPSKAATPPRAKAQHAIIARLRCAHARNAQPRQPRAQTLT
jgi:hypothetical protein